MPYPCSPVARQTTWVPYAVEWRVQCAAGPEFNLSRGR